MSYEGIEGGEITCVGRVGEVGEMRCGRRRGIRGVRVEGGQMSCEV